jgi:hypothetical protein
MTDEMPLQVKSVSTLAVAFRDLPAPVPVLNPLPANVENMVSPQ